MNPNELIVLGIVFVLVWSVTFSLIYRSIVTTRRSRERLRSTDADDPTTEETPLVLGELTPGLADQVPMTPRAKNELHRELLAAGFYRPTAMTEYAAVRTVLVVTPLFVSGVVALILDQRYLLTVLTCGLLAAMLGFSFPRLFLRMRAKWRAREVERGLPVTVDMLTLCLTAGQNVIQSLKRVSNELAFSNRVLAEELGIVRQQAELRTLQSALQQFAERVQVPEVRNLTMILIQSERLGTDAGATLLEYANNLRTNARQRADAKANKTMFWMLFPTLLCLWIPAGIVLIGPAILEFQYYRKTQFEQWRQSRREMQELQRAAREALPGAPAQPQGQ